MNLVGFTVENVRSVRDRVVVEGLSPWEVFHGDNNVGKSNLLLGLRTALLLVELVWGEDPPGGIGRDADADDALTTEPGVARLSSERLPQLAPHWDRPDAPIRLGLRFADGSGAVVALWFVVERAGGGWAVVGTWTDSPDERVEGLLPRGDRPPIPAPKVRFVDAQRLTPPVDAGRIGPSATLSWDEWLLTQKDEEQEGSEWVVAYQRLEGALANLVEGFDGGRLDRVVTTDRGRRGAPRQELVWITKSNRRLRFEEQGSGVRAMKDLLVAAAAGSGLCLLEEPELHLSELMQLKLRRVLEKLIAPREGVAPLQMILTSHTAMFDHPGARKVWLEGGTTQVGEPGVRSGPQGGLDAEWREARHNAGYVTALGVVRLPTSVLGQLQLPGLVSFAPLGDARFVMAPARDEAGADEGEP